MFVAFMVQIVFRYLFNFPIGWTSELKRPSLAMAGALGRRFVGGRRGNSLRLVYGAGGPVRAPSPWESSPGLSIVILYAPRCRQRSNVSSMKVEKTSFSRFSFDLLFSIYACSSSPSLSVTLDPVAPAARKDPETPIRPS